MNLRIWLGGNHSVHKQHSINTSFSWYRRGAQWGSMRCFVNAKRLLVTIVTSALLVACTRSSYLYVRLAGDNVEGVESGRPPLAD